MTGPTRRLVDSAAKWGITVGGVFVILCILGMMVFLGSQVAPLWKGPTTEKDVSFSVAAGEGDARVPVIVAANEYREVFFEVSRDTSYRIYQETQPGQPPELALEGRIAAPDSLGPVHFECAAPLDAGARQWILGTRRGSLLYVDLDDGVEFTAGGRRYTPSIRPGTFVPITRTSIRRIAGVPSEDPGGFVASAWSGSDTLHVFRRDARTNVMGNVTFTDSKTHLLLPAATAPLSLALDYEGTHAFVGTEAGTLLEYTVANPHGAPDIVPVYANQGITALGMLVGGHSLVVGGAAGRVEVWFRARAADGSGAPRLIQGHSFDSHRAAVEGYAASNRDRTFLTWDATGIAKLHYATSSSTRLSFEIGIAEHMTMAPKGDGLVIGRTDGTIESWNLENPHPEASPNALFTKVHYEGYPKPGHVWQSTGASDEFEPKLGLMPLIFGTLKGTFYALLFSVPIAVFAAVYTSLFMHPQLRSIVKPTMEMMAALPSVVLGFLAGLWLAPVLQHSMPAALLAPLPLAVAIVGFGWLWRRLPRTAAARIWPGTETFALIAVIIATIGLCVGLNPAMDGAFEGGFLHWLYATFDFRYDQRNALVIGIAMGLAVIPIIFTISEDSLSNVPRALKAASLALGATPWQTAWRVVLPAASPGIFAAIVIGLGRAVGETMIVLMATGNTPIMDWSPFNGLRTLAANIAVEIPEAPHEGSLYRILFLTALILFAMTFVVNTVAEVVRHRLRQKYSRF